MTDIAGPPNKRTSTCPVGTLSSAAVLDRQGKVRTAAAKARATYPLAASNLLWWLDGVGKRRDVGPSDFDFRSPDCGLSRHLVDTHRRVIALGSRSGVEGVPAGALGIEGRLRLPASDPKSLQPGRDQILDWEDSVRAKGYVATPESYEISPAPERDLGIALGGYTVHSRVTLRTQTPVETGQKQSIEVVSWQVQVCDYYNWIVSRKAGICVGAQAPIFIPPGIDVPPIPEGAGSVSTFKGSKVVITNDLWFAEVEAAGGARPFELYSEVFDAPADVRANFEAVNGTIQM